MRGQSLANHTVLDRFQTPAPQFAGLVQLANKGVSAFTHALYDQGEGMRYAVEQTLGYTFPRTYQQLGRTKKETGEWNYLAGLEIFIRDLAADFADTFLPGLLATYGIGKVLDRKHNTFVRHNMGSDALNAYQHFAKTPDGQFATRQQFFNNLEGWIAQATQKEKVTEKVSLGLEHALSSGQSTEAIAKEVAQKLSLNHFALELPLPQQAGKTLSLTLPELLEDLSHLAHSKAPGLTEAASHTWGEAVSGLLGKTTRLMKHQMWGNIAALAASISIPFGIRLMTKHIYGKDAFPGTEELHKHFDHKDEKEAARHESGKFHLFPYLSRSLGEGKILPTLLTTGFFAALGGLVLRRFKIAGLSPTQLKNWFKVYEFDRSFPFTTVKQMELTYGLLCGFRLASSRDEAEFRETGIRDCLMGYPTLTYFFPWFRRILGNVMDGRLAKQFGAKGLLMKTPTAIRTGAELTPDMLKHVGPLNTETGVVAQAAKLAQSWTTFITAGISWVLLAFAEPEIGIRITNHLELKKLAALKNQPKGPQFGTHENTQPQYSQPLQRNQALFMAFQQNIVHATN
jgi:hypothetical protein